MALNSLMYPGEFEHFLGTPSRQLVQQTQRRRFWGTQLVGLMSDFTDGQALCVDFGRQPRGLLPGSPGTGDSQKGREQPSPGHRVGSGQHRRGAGATFSDLASSRLL